MDSCDELIKCLDKYQFDLLLQCLKRPAIGEKLRSSDSNKLIRSILIVCHKCIDISNKKIDASHSNDILYECFRLLRNACAGGQNIQNQIVDFKEESINTFEIIKSVLFEHVLNNKIQKICWQFVANLSVGNAYSQRTIRNECIEQILNKFNCVCDSGNQRECTMILYNHCIGQCNTRNDTKRIIEFLLECAYNRNAIDHGLDSNDFYRIFMDNFITNYADVVPVYDKIESSEKRLYLLYYIADHLKDIKHEVISSKLLQFICKDFKKKYDCVLKTLNSVHLKEVMTILELIARASSDERYSQYLNFDSNLFLNVGELLRQIVEIGKREPTTDQPNIFAPIRNLEQLAPNFEGDLTIERDISYGLKSTLIRIIANLAYKNKINQELARDADIMMAIFDSTNLDARNPLIKEWSILAIRNLCENNAENQQTIRQLNKIGDDTKSSVLKEFDKDSGTMRIRTDG